MIKQLLLLALMTLSLSANSIEDLFQKGNSFYQNEAFDSAAFYFDEVLRKEVSSVVLYNRGNTAYRQDDIGLAILCLERALLRDPSQEDIKKSLAFMKTQRTDKQADKVESFIERSYNSVKRIFTVEVAFWIISFLSFLFAVVLYFILYRKGNRRLLSIYLGGSLLALIIGLGVFAGIGIHQKESRQEAVVLCESCVALNEPMGSTTIFKAHAGTKLQIVTANGKWCKVALQDGTTGWIKSKSIGMID